LAWLFLCRRKFEFHRKQVVTDWSKHWSFGKWVLGGQIIGTLHAYTPAWVLMFAIGAAATGVFTACEQIVLLCNPLLLVIANLFGAITARAYADGGYPAVRKVVNYASIYGFTAMVVFWLALVFVGGQAVVLLYGDEFLGNGHVISTIALAAPMWAITTVMAVGLRSVEKPDTDFRARVAGLLITFIGSALAVKSWGVLAVAYALVAGSAVSALWQAYAFYCIVSDEELPSGHRESGPTRN
jgi:O-antigen/teichoic acid export membrane protein